MAPVWSHPALFGRYLVGLGWRSVRAAGNHTGDEERYQFFASRFFLPPTGMKKRSVLKAGWSKVLRRLCGRQAPARLYLPAARRRALPILQRRRGPSRRLRLRSFPSFAARWSITECIWLCSAIAGNRWSAPQGTVSMDIPSSAYIKTARSWKKTESARP